MARDAGRLFHMVITPAVRSTLADANRNRDSRLLSGLFARMIGVLSRDSGAIPPEELELPAGRTLLSHRIHRQALDHQPGIAHRINASLG